MTKAKTRKPKSVEPFWKEAVDTYLNFMRTKFSCDIPFVGAAPRDLKGILKVLREQTEAKNILWTSELCCRMLKIYFEFAWINGNVVRSTQWFMPMALKYKNEILEQIHQYKIQKNAI